MVKARLEPVTSGFQVWCPNHSMGVLRYFDPNVESVIQKEEEELPIEHGLVLKGDLVVIPPTLRLEVLNIIHQGRLRQEKCVLRTRTHVFWPGIINSREVVNQVDQCEPSQKYQKKAKRAYTTARTAIPTMRNT